MIRGKSSIGVRNNVKITGWQVTDGKKEIFYEHKKHNIWLDQGRTWLGNLIVYNLAGYVGRADPPAPWPANHHDPEPSLVFEDRRLFYAALGIGGNQQTGPIPAAVDAAYPGGNTYSDADASVRGLERPVRVLSQGAAPGPYWTRWLVPAGTVTFSPTPLEWVQLTFEFLISDINPAVWPPGIPPAYTVVPVAEAALYHWEVDASMGRNYIVGDPDYLPPAPVLNEAVAYATFPTLPKTGGMGGIGITLEWILELL